MRWAPHNTEFYSWMGKKHVCFFQTAKTGNRTPNSSVKGSGAYHYTTLLPQPAFQREYFMPTPFKGHISCPHLSKGVYPAHIFHKAYIVSKPFAWLFHAHAYQRAYIMPTPFTWRIYRSHAFHMAYIVRTPFTWHISSPRLSHGVYRPHVFHMVYIVPTPLT